MMDTIVKEGQISFKDMKVLYDDHWFKSQWVRKKAESQPINPDWLHTLAMINSIRFYNYINKIVASNKKVISVLCISLMDERLYSRE